MQGHKGKKDLWVLDWVNHYGYESSIEDDKLVSYNITRNRSPFGDIIPNEAIKEILLNGVKSDDKEIANKYTNTYEFFESF